MRKLSMLLLFLSLISCKDIIKEALKSTSAAEEKEVKSTIFNEVIVDSVFKLSLPDYMKKLTILNDEANLQYGHVFKETYAIVISENKQEFIDRFKEIEEYNDSISVIDNYSQVQVKFINENVEQQQVIPYNLKTINGRDARQVMLKSEFEGEKVGYILGFVEGYEDLYMIMTWTMQDRLNKYEETFKDIISSFELIN